jgi:hypothetical protein
VGASLAVGLALALVAVWAPWSSPSPIVYETVSGWPMWVYYRNLGSAPARLTDVGGMPALGVDAPLSDGEIEAHFAVLREHLKVAPTLVAAGDFVRFKVDDPGELAWKPGKTDGTTWFYVFAITKAPRAALVLDRWVGELCLVAQTGEKFSRCPTHNRTYAGN